MGVQEEKEEVEEVIKEGRMKLSGVWYNSLLLIWCTGSSLQISLRKSELYMSKFHNKTEYKDEINTELKLIR